jgi:hypothetical protein
MQMPVMTSATVELTAAVKHQKPTEFMALIPIIRFQVLSKTIAGRIIRQKKRRPDG